MLLGGEQKNKSLRFRLVLWVWAISSSITFLFTFLQLYIEYSQTKSQAVKQFTIVSKQYLPILSKSVWDYNYEYTELYSKVIKGLPHIAFVSLRTNDSQLDLFLPREGLSEKEVFLNNDEVRKRFGFSRMDLMYNNQRLGELVLGIDLVELKIHYFERAVQIFIIQSLKAFLTCFLLFQMFSHVILRHLLKVVDYLQNFNLSSKDNVKLDRNPKIKDELYLLEMSLNKQKENLVDVHNKLDHINQDLAKEVELRTEERDKEREKLIEASRLASLGTMAGGIAHEINNPLNIIRSSTSFMKKAKSKEKLTDIKFFESVENIESMVVRVNSIVDGLKKISRKGELENDEYVNIKECFDDILNVSRERFELSGVDLQIYHFEDQDGLNVYGNLVQLSQVMINLLNNSYDAIENLEQKWVKINIKTDEDSVIIQHMDSGSGIPESLKNKIFDPFFTSKEVGKGTGLGLSLSKKIIESFGGELSLNDNLENTCFEIKLRIYNQGEVSESA